MAFPAHPPVEEPKPEIKYAATAGPCLNALIGACAVPEFQWTFLQARFEVIIFP